jgi:tRNA pseudouridine55 synthase
MELNGWLVLDKPNGITSNKALMILKKLLKPKKIGHAGTLDPFATGILMVALGDATKTVQYAMGSKKTYEFEITWGQTRDSHDIDGAIVEESDARPTLPQLQETLKLFMGEISQIPPEYSAIKINGKRACDIMREGKSVELKPRNVKIYDLDLLKHNNETAYIRVTCSKGFYIRSLARDIAKNLNVLGYVTKLRRVESGPFKIEKAISLDYIEKIVHNELTEELDKALCPIDAVLDDILVQQVTEDESKKLRFGQKLPFLKDSQDDIAVKHNGKLVAMCYSKDGYLHPKTVFNY